MSIDKTVMMQLKQMLQSKHISVLKINKIMKIIKQDQILSLLEMPQEIQVTKIEDNN